MSIQFPATHLPDAWKGVVLTAIRALAPTGGEVRFAQVVSWVAAQPGFPGWDAWGSMTKRGQAYPKGQRAITLAAGKLKADGTIRCPRRGYYALCASALDASEAAPAAPEAPTPTQTQAEPEKAPVARPVSLNIVVQDGVRFTPQSGAVNSAAYDAADAGLRRMAAEQTRCFGAWSSRSDQCNGCPLAGLCQQAGMADFAEVAAALDAQTEAEITSAEARVAQPAAPAADEVPVPDTTATPGAPGAVALPFACPCHSCGNEIPAGGMAVYREASDGGGVFHPECFS